MSDISTLKDIVNDYLQTAAVSIVDTTLELEGNAANKQTLVDKLILRAANNARKKAEKKHDWSWNDETLEGVIPMTGKGLHLDGFYVIPNLSGTLVVTSGSGALAMDIDQDINLDTYIPFKDSDTHMFLKDEASPAGFSGQAAAIDEAGNLRAAWPNYTFTGVLGSIPDGTYEVSVRSAPSNQYLYAERFAKIKTIHNGWIVDTTDDSEVPLRIERKPRTASRLLEHMEARLPSGVAWNFTTLLIHGRRAFLYPASTTEDQTVRLDANIWSADYTEDDDSDEFLVHGFDYMQWATIVEVNRLLRVFVPRQEGNLPPPIRERDEALEELIDFDVYQTAKLDSEAD